MSRKSKALWSGPALERLDVGGVGPEDVVADSAGRLLCGLDDGRIVRIDPRRRTRETLVNTLGRPLGLHSNADGSLLICDAERGLLRLVAGAREAQVLVSEVQGEPLTFCSNVVQASDGVIYFTASSRRYGLRDYASDLAEVTCTGRLMSLSPTGHVTVLRDGLDFANGVALSVDESFLVVAETGSFRLNRFWLRGARLGDFEQFGPTLPGFPDNIGADAGVFWVAIASPPDPRLTAIHRLPAAARHRLARAQTHLPTRLRPAPVRRTGVLALDTQGTVLHDLRWGDGSYRMITGVCVLDGRLYVSSLVEEALGALDRPGLPLD